MLAEATHATDQIFRRHQTAAPVDVLGIARDLGIAVFQSEELGGPNLSGKLFRDTKHGGRSGWSIIVKASDPLVRQRFTIAHEIAHFVLHKDKIRNGVLTDDEFYRSGLSSLEETQANRMAADILMPWHLIDTLTKAGITYIPELARKLVVSQVALKIRLGIPVTE